MSEKIGDMVNEYVALRAAIRDAESAAALAALEKRLAEVKREMGEVMSGQG
jgi:hypothetical protein